MKAILGEKTKEAQKADWVYFAFTAKGKTSSGNTWKLKGIVKGPEKDGHDPFVEDVIQAVKDTIAASAPYLVPTEITVKRLKGKPRK